jgi:IclR family pca regulon transcriptional regulator
VRKRVSLKLVSAALDGYRPICQHPGTVDIGYSNLLPSPGDDTVFEDPVPYISPEPVTKYSRSIEYTVAVLQCFTPRRRVLRISELAEMLHISRSTTHRYVSTLREHGYLEQDKNRRYRLTQRASAPGVAFIEVLRLETPSARRILEDLREETGYTVSMGVLDGGRVLYTHRLFAHGRGQYEADLGLEVGAFVPAYCTAIGKALLASLGMPEQRKIMDALKLRARGPNTIVKKTLLTDELLAIHAVGFAACDGEQAPGVRSIAAVLVHPGRSRPMAISVSVPPARMSILAMRTKLGQPVRKAAERIRVLSVSHLARCRARPGGGHGTVVLARARVPSEKTKTAAKGKLSRGHVGGSRRPCGANASETPSTLW